MGKTIRSAVDWMTAVAISVWAHAHLGNKATLEDVKEAVESLHRVRKEAEDKKQGPYRKPPERAKKKSAKPDSEAEADIDEDLEELRTMTVEQLIDEWRVMKPGPAKHVLDVLRQRAVWSTERGDHDGRDNLYSPALTTAYALLDAIARERPLRSDAVLPLLARLPAKKVKDLPAGWWEAIEWTRRSMEKARPPYWTGQWFDVRMAKALRIGGRVGDPGHLYVRQAGGKEGQETYWLALDMASPRELLSEYDAWNRGHLRDIKRDGRCVFVKLTSTDEPIERQVSAKVFEAYKVEHWEESLARSLFGDVLDSFGYATGKLVVLSLRSLGQLGNRDWVAYSQQAAGGAACQTG